MLAERSGRRELLRWRMRRLSLRGAVVSVQRAGLPEQALRRAKVQHCGADGTSNQGCAAIKRPGLVTECVQASAGGAVGVPSQLADCLKTCSRWVLGVANLR